MNKLIKCTIVLKYLNMILIGLNTAVLLFAFINYSKWLLFWGLLGISFAIFGFRLCINAEHLINKHLE